MEEINKQKGSGGLSYSQIVFDIQKQLSNYVTLGGEILAPHVLETTLLLYFFFLVFFLLTRIFIVQLVTAVMKLHTKFVLVCRRATVSMIPTNLQLNNLFSCYLEILNSKSLSTVYQAQQGFVLTCTCIYKLYEIIEI